MASKISPCLLACVFLFLAQNIAAKSLVGLQTNCGYVACNEKDLETEDGFHASGSAISSQFLLPDGSVVTNSKETSISSDGIKQTFHQLKKEADHFVQTGQGNLAINSHLPNLPPVVPVSSGSYYSSSGSSSHNSYAQTAKDHELENKLIYNLSPASSNSHYNQFQSQHNAEHQSSNGQVCDVCGVYHSGVSGGKSDATASYNTIVGNVAPSVASSSSYQKYESASQQRNASQQSSQPILFSNSLSPNTFTTNIVDLNQNHNNQNGQGSETHIDYHESGSGQIKTSERVISQPAYSGGLLYPSKQVIVEVSKPGASAVSSQSYQKQESSSQVQQSGIKSAPVPISVYVKQAEGDLVNHQRQEEHLAQTNSFRSPVLVGGVPQNIPLDGGHSSSYYSSSSSSSSSKTVSSSDGGSPVVVHQSIPQKYSSSSGYTSGGSFSSSSQNAPEVYYNGNRVHGVSSSIYDNVRGESNVETLCPTCQPCVTCTYVAGSPVKNSYGVATSYSSQSSTINGKTTENREAAVAVNDNGKVDSYRVKT